MPHESNQSHADELRRRREDIRRSVFRTGRGLAVIMAAMLVLVAAVVIFGARSAREEQRATQAEQTAREQLHNSHLAEARATRLAGRMGRRLDALAAIGRAAAIRPTLELRNEALACLPLLDMDDHGICIPPTEPSLAEFDRPLQRYAFTDPERKVHVLRREGRQELFVLDANAVIPPEGGAIQNLYFSPDGRHLGARFRGGAMVVWDLENRQARVVTGKSAKSRALGTLCYAPASNQAAFANADRDGQISVFDLATGTEVAHFDIKVGARFFRFKPDTTNLVAVATDERVEFWEADSGRLQVSLPHGSRVAFFRWAEGGRRLWVACQGGEVYDWDVPHQSFRVLSGHGEACISLQPTPDGKHLITGSRDGTTRFWDLKTGRSVLEIPRGTLLQLDEVGTQAMYWQPGVGYGIWELRPGTGVRGYSTDPAMGALLSFDLSPDGQWAVGTQSKGFQLWELASGRSQFFAVPDLQLARFTIDAKSLLLGRQRGLELWPFEPAPTPAGGTNGIRFGEARAIPVPGARGVRALALSADGRTLVVEAGDYATSVVDLRGRKPPVAIAERPNGQWTRGPASVTGAGRFAVSPDGRWLAQGMGFGNQPVVWDTASGQRVKVLEAELGVVGFSGDGSRLLVGTPRSYDLFAVGTWERVWQWRGDEVSSTLGAAALAGDGTWAAIAPTRRTLRLVSLQSGETLADLQTPGRQVVHSPRLSADGHTLAVALADDSLLVWDLKSLRAQLRPLALDWSLDPVPPVASPRVARAARRGVSPLAMGLGLVFVAALTSGFVLRRHRNIVREYVATEALSDQRRRELDFATVELMHSQKMRALGTLAAGIAHDFNNLLSVIRMANKLIGREVPNHAEVREHVADVEDAVRQGKQLVGSMLGYSRPRPDDATPQDLDEIVEETVALLSKEFLSGIALTLELDRDLPPVCVGGGKIEQILLNLLVNASEAMKGQGKLRITSRARPSAAVAGLALAPRAAPRFVDLAVADSGPGIPAEVLPRIFEPFFTTKSDPNRRGTGLGLSLVYNLAEQDGLGLAVESEPGRGTCFRLLIPLAAAAPGVRDSHSSQPAGLG